MKTIKTIIAIGLLGAINLGCENNFSSVKSSDSSSGLGQVITPPTPVPDNPLNIEMGWTSVANTKLMDFCPNGIDCAGVIGAWNSAAMDTVRNRLLLFGGGHGDYNGNEIYSFNLETLSMTRLNDPTTPAVTGCEDLGPLPSSRHTYDGLVYIPESDALVSFTGASFPTGCASKAIWSYGFGLNQWTRKYNGPILALNGGGTASSYSTKDKKVYLIDGFDLYSYENVTGGLIKLTSGSHGLNPTYSVMVYVESKNWLVAHDSSDGDFVYFDLNEANIVARSFPTTGPQNIINSYYPGMAYYPVRESIVAYPTGGKDVFELDLDTGVWARITPPGFDPGPNRPNYQGTFERFSYSKQSNVFVLVKSAIDDVLLLRLD